MRIRLSNGRIFKLGWQHTEVSDAVLKQMEGRGEVKAASLLCEHFDALLEQHFHDKAFYYGCRIHGVSECFLLEISESGEPLNAFSGIAWCSAKDTFNKEKGRKRSLADALDRLDLPKPLRSEVWTQYFKRK